VSGVASIAPSNSAWAQAHHKGSTTHGSSCKEVVVITLLPTHWPDKLVVGPLNSYLSSHRRAIHAVSKTWNHLGGLALVCDVLPIEDDIQAMHTYFDTAAKRICDDDTVEMQVEIGLSKSFLCIPNFLYFGTKLSYKAKGKPVPITPEEVKEILLTSKWKDTIYLYQGAMPCLIRNSYKSDTCTVFFDIHNSQGGQHLHSLKGALYSGTNPLPSFLLRSKLESPSALDVGGMATVPQCAPSRPSCVPYVLDLISLSTIVFLVHAAKHSPR
jgi:hypothetical protein